MLPVNPLSLPGQSCCTSPFILHLLLPPPCCRLPAAKGRALLEQARLKNPKSDQLWLAAVRMELRAGNTKAAEATMAKALQVGRRGSVGRGGRGVAPAGLAAVTASCPLVALTVCKFGGCMGVVCRHAGQLRPAGCACELRACLLCMTCRCVMRAALAAGLPRQRHPVGGVHLHGASPSAQEQIRCVLCACWGRSCLAQHGARFTHRARGFTSVVVEIATTGSAGLCRLCLCADPPCLCPAAAVDALKKCNDNPWVVAAVANLFWQVRSGPL